MKVLVSEGVAYCHLNNIALGDRLPAIGAVSVVCITDTSVSTHRENYKICHRLLFFDGLTK